MYKKLLLLLLLLLSLDASNALLVENVRVEEGSGKDASVDDVSVANTPKSIDFRIIDQERISSCMMRRVFFLSELHGNQIHNGPHFERVKWSLQ